MEKGRVLAEAALQTGPLEMVSVDELAPDGIVLTCSAVGAPAAPTAYASPETAIRVVEMMRCLNNLPLAGLITNENGGGSTFNGWLPAVVCGLPLVDAPCNGRAHPTGLMGSMSLHRDESYRSYQTVAGGNEMQGSYLEASFFGAMDSVVSLVRRCAVQAGGLVSVARNPVTLEYVAAHGAAGALTQAIELGHVMKEVLQQGGEAVAQAVAVFLGGSVITLDPVDALSIVTEGGFDHGHVTIGDFEVPFWNEYMTLERNGQRLGTFPDLFMTLDQNSGLPVTAAEIRKGQTVVLVCVPAENLRLGSAMKCKELFQPIETVIGRDVLSYVTTLER